MCGIVGYIKQHENVDPQGTQSFLNQALYVDTMRGFDSTGVISVDNKFTIETVKSTLPGHKFVNSKAYHTMNTDGWACIGHNRAATHGSIKEKNAHPFLFGTIAMVHNGTLTNKGANLDHQKKHLEVDSAVIAYNLSKEAPEDAHTVLGRLWGSYALVWTDSRDESVNIVRNDTRPLHFAYNKAKTAMFFMSDPYMLNMVCNRPGTRATSIGTIYKLGSMQLLKYKKGNMTPEVTNVVPFTQSRNRWWPDLVVTGTSPRRRNIGTGMTTGRISSATSPRIGPTKTGTSRFDARPRVGQVLVNGEAQQIPAIHREMLDVWFEINTTVRLKFRPDYYVPWNDTRGMVYGEIIHPVWHEPYDAVMYNICQAAWEVNGGQSWTTLPVGVTYVTPDDGDTTCFILRDLFYAWYQGESQKEKEGRSVYGPGGNLISGNKWVELTAHGCEICGGNLSVLTHQDILWAGEHGNQPVCKDCATELTNPGVKDDKD